jgi:hypothetical protein
MQSGDDIRGECHCGRVRVRITLARPVGEIELRACQCSFCRRHGARTFADPNGRAVIEAQAAETLRRYRFGLKTADYLMCGECGAYIGVLLEAGGAQLVTINAAGLDIEEFRNRSAKPVDYEAEAFEERVRRRLAAWMPAELNVLADAKEERAVH